MSRECPVCNSDVPADGRCCNVKCEAYSHRVLDVLVESQQVFVRGNSVISIDDTEYDGWIECLASGESFTTRGEIPSSRQTATEIRELREDFNNVLKEKQQEIFNQIVEAQKEFGKHTIYKKEFTNTDDEIEDFDGDPMLFELPEGLEIDRRYIDPCNTLDDRINHDITKQVLSEAKIDTESEPATLTVENLCGWEPVEIPTDFKWTGGEMYYQLPKVVPATYDYYLTDSVTIESPEYSWYLHFESGDRIRLSDNEAYKMLENGVPDKVNLTYDRVEDEDE